MPSITLPTISPLLVTALVVRDTRGVPFGDSQLNKSVRHFGDILECSYLPTAGFVIFEEAQSAISCLEAFYGLAYRPSIHLVSRYVKK